MFEYMNLSVTQLLLMWGFAFFFRNEQSPFHSICVALHCWLMHCMFIIILLRIFVTLVGEAVL